MPGGHVADADAPGEGRAVAGEGRLPAFPAVDLDGSSGRRDAAGGDLEADELAAHALLLDAEQRVAPDEVALVEPDRLVEARLEGIGALVDVARIDVVDLLETEHADRLVAAELEAVVPAGGDDGVVHRVGVARIVDDLVAELAGDAETRDDAVDASDLRLDEAEIGQRLVRDVGLGDLLKDVAGLRPLDLDDRGAAGQVLDLDVHAADVPAHPSRRLADVEGRRRQQIVVGRQAEHDEVVDDSAVLVEQARIEAAPGFGFDVVGADLLHGVVRLRPPEMELAHLMAVEEHGGRAARLHFVLHGGEGLRHLPAGEVEEAVGPVGDVLAVVRRTFQYPGHRMVLGLAVQRSSRRGMFDPRCHFSKWFLCVWM